jgi:hypothetical protein
MKFLRPPPISTVGPRPNGGGNQLLGDVDAAFAHGLRGQVAVVLPVAFRRMGEGGAGRGMGDARGGDHAGGHAAVDASSHRVSEGAASAAAQSLRAADCAMLSTPARVFTPVAIALMVPAESGVCESVL